MAVKGSSGETQEGMPARARRRAKARATGDAKVRSTKPGMVRTVADADAIGTSKAPDDLTVAVTEARAALEKVLDAIVIQTDLQLGNVAVSAEALRAFVEAASEVLGDRQLTIDAARRAGLVAAASTAWEDALGAQLTSAQVRDILGGVTRQRVDELLRQRRLIGMQATNSRWVFPAFQFRDGHAPAAGLATAFWTLSSGGMDPWSAASWCVSPNDQLDGATPADVAEGDVDLVALVAARDAARLSR